MNELFYPLFTYLYIIYLFFIKTKVLSKHCWCQLLFSSWLLTALSLAALYIPVFIIIFIPCWKKKKKSKFGFGF